VGKAVRKLYDECLLKLARTTNIIEQLRDSLCDKEDE
jgi:hypothetical protein